MVVSFSVMSHLCPVLITLAMLLSCTIADKYLLVELESEPITFDVGSGPIPGPKEDDAITENEPPLDDEPEEQSDTLEPEEEAEPAQDSTDNPPPSAPPSLGKPGKKGMRTLGRKCCRAYTAECNACTLGQSIQQYCQSNPQTRGCQDKPYSRYAVNQKGPKKGGGYRMDWGEVETTLPTTPAWLKTTKWVAPTTTTLEPIDCIMGKWGRWSKWDCENKEDECGACTKERVKKVKSKCENGGDCSCKAEKEKDGKDTPCPIDCVMAEEFGPWGKCKCPGGKKCVPYEDDEKCLKRRVKRVAKKGKYGGKDDCEMIKEMEDCTKKCPTTTPVAPPPKTTRWTRPVVKTTRWTPPPTTPEPRWG